MKKYEITEKTKVAYGVKLHQIRALVDILDDWGNVLVHKGDVGGWIEKEENLSQDGQCWIRENNSYVMGNAYVCNDAYILTSSVIRDNAQISGKATVAFSTISDEAKVYGNARVHSCTAGGTSQIYGNAVAAKVKIGIRARIFGDAAIYTPGQMPMDRDAVAWKKEHFFTKKNLVFTRDALGRIFVTRCFSKGYTIYRLDQFVDYCKKHTQRVYKDFLQIVEEAKDYIDTTPYMPDNAACVKEIQEDPKSNDSDFVASVVFALEKSGYKVIRPEEKNKGMTINEYQRLAQRTANTKRPSDKLENACLGLAGETGEVCDILKKYLFQGHELDRPHMIEEAGDIAWYLAELAASLGVSLEDILLQNIAKLKRRYPDGFDPERSMNREAGA